MDLNRLGIQAATLLHRRYAHLLNQEEIVRIDFSHYRGVRRVELVLIDQSQGTNMEFFVDVPGLDDDEAIYLGLDFLDGVLAEHLESDREALPRLDPAPYCFEGHTVYLCGQLRRPDLEAAADALLAQEHS